MTIKFDDIEDENIRKILEEPTIQSKIQSRIDSSVSSLQSKNQELLNELKTLKGSLEEFGGLDNIKNVLKELENKKLDKARSEGDLKGIETKYMEQLSAKDKELQTLRNTIVEKEIKSLVSSALAKYKASELLEPFIKQRIRGGFQDGVVIEFVNEDGAPMLTSKGTKASIDDLIEEFRQNERFKPLFPAPKKSGSGTDSSVNTDDGFNPFDRNDKRFNLTKAMEFYKQNPEKAKQLAAKVGFKIE